MNNIYSILSAEVLSGSNYLEKTPSRSRGDLSTFAGTLAVEILKKYHIISHGATGPHRLTASTPAISPVNVSASPGGSGKKPSFVLKEKRATVQEVSFLWNFPSSSYSLLNLRRFGCTVSDVIKRWLSLRAVIILNRLQSFITGTFLGVPIRNAHINIYLRWQKCI